MSKLEAYIERIEREKNRPTGRQVTEALTSFLNRLLSENRGDIISFSTVVVERAPELAELSLFQRRMIKTLMKSYAALFCGKYSFFWRGRRLSVKRRCVLQLLQQLMGGDDGQ